MADEEEDLLLQQDATLRLISKRFSEDSSSSRDRASSGGSGDRPARRSSVVAATPASESRMHVNVLVAVVLSTVVLFGIVHNFRHNTTQRYATDPASRPVSAMSANATGVAKQAWELAAPGETAVDCEPVVVTVPAEPPPPPPVHPLLERVMVSVASHWDVTRLTYLERVLMGINEWRSPRVDVCLGSNRPELLDEIIGQQGSLHFLNKSGNIRTCPLPGDLFHESALNWRSREILGERFLDEEANYTAFIFLENDLVLTWDALVAWAQDTALLEPYGLKRSFFRTEVNPDTAQPMHQEFTDGDRFVQHAIIPTPEQQDQTAASSSVVLSVGNGTVVGRRFVQLVSYTYCGVIVASRAQFRRYMKSNFWRVEDGGRCCDPGAREFASWGFLFFEVPDNQWGSTGLIPWDEEQHAMDRIAMLMHRPNNYVIQGHSKASKTSLRAVHQLIDQWVSSNPPAALHLHDFDAPQTRHRLLRAADQQQEDEERRLASSLRAARAWRGARG